MLKYIGDFDKLKDYGFEKDGYVDSLKFFMNGMNSKDAWIEKKGEYWLSFELHIDYETRVVYVMIYDTDQPDDDRSLNVLYELIKDGLVIKETA